MKDKRFTLCAVAMALAMAVMAQAYNDQATYPGRANYGALRFSQPSAYHSYLMLDLHRANAERDVALRQALASEESLRSYIDDVKQRLQRLVGRLPERTPIDGRVVGTVAGNGFRVEKVVFESLPGRYVTAHLYLPNDVKKPIPACVEMCGHSLTGKGDGSGQAVAMVRNGIAVLVVDPIAQGERLQLIDSAGCALTRGVTTEHTLLNPALCLLGSSLAAQEFWDNSRAIDYLLTRSDIDGEKIGAYGFSGGGTQATYLMALDERVAVSCVGLFFSNRARTLDIQGPSDGCQQIAGEGREHIELADFALAAAPKPFLVLDGKYDFVDHWGALQGFEEVRQAYELLGCGDRVKQYYSADGHACPPDAMLRMVSWFKKWFVGDEQVDEGSLTSGWQGEDMRCTVAGQVNLEFADARSLMDEATAVMDQLSGQRSAFVAGASGDVRQKLMELLGLPETFNDSIEAVPSGRSSLREYEEYRYQLNCEGQMPVACVIWVPSSAQADSPIEIHLHEQGKAWFLSDLSKRDAVSDGTLIVAADCIGIGEMEDPYIYNYSKYWNRDYRLAATALHIGRPLMGQRVAALRTLLNFCEQNEQLAGRAVRVVADGVFGPVVMHAAVLDERISRATLTRCLKTWRSYLEQPLQRDMLANVLQGALQYYDLPDLIKLSGGRVKVVD